MTKEVGNLLLIELTGNRDSDVSNAILYKLLFFSGIPDHDSVKLCYSRSQLFFIHFYCLTTVDMISLQRMLIGFRLD